MKNSNIDNFAKEDQPNAVPGWTWIFTGWVVKQRPGRSGCCLKCKTRCSSTNHL